MSLPGMVDVAVGENEDGGQRIVVLATNEAYESDDGGNTWSPFFIGLSRRSYVRVVSGPRVRGGLPRWWILTSSELWAAHDPQSEVDVLNNGDAVGVRWAQGRLRSTRPLALMLDEATRFNKLHVEDINGVIERETNANLMPTIDVRGLAVNQLFARHLEQMIVPLRQDRQWSQPQWQFFVQATWHLPDAVYRPDTNTRRRTFYVHRDRLSFGVEDAWNERISILRRMAAGRVNRLQAEILRARVETLEALLELWTGRPFAASYDWSWDW